MDTGFLNSLAFRLKVALDPADWAWVLAALRQDTTIWENLQDEEFHSEALMQIGKQSRGWSPAVLALLALGAHEPPAIQLVYHLRDDLQYSLDAGLRRKAAQVFEEPSNSLNPSLDRDDVRSGELDLKQAGLIALALRERRRVMGTWDGLPGELVLANRGDLSNWATPLACLYGITPDPLDMLHALVSSNTSPDWHKLALHAVLSNPFPEEEQAELFLAMLTRLPRTGRLALLRQISYQRPTLAARLAQKLLALRQTGDLARSVAELEAGAYLAHMDILSILLLQAETYQIADKVEDATPLLAEARNTALRLQSVITAGSAEAAEKRGEMAEALSAWEQAAELTPNPTDALLYRTRKAQVLLESGQLEQARACLPDVTSEQAENGRAERAFFMAGLAGARLTAAGGDEEYARQSAMKLVESAEGTGSFPKVEDVPALVNLAELLVELGLPEEAVRVARAALTLRPNQPEILIVSGKASSQAGFNEEAIEAAQIAAALEPERDDIRCQLAGYLETAGAWAPALNERLALAEASPDLQSADDWLALAACALRASQPQHAVEACRRAFACCEDDSACSLAHVLMGKVQASLQKPQIAQEHFTKATQLTPHKAEPWLALVRVQKDSGQTQRALETLRAASQAAPDSAEIQLALGEAYLEDWEGRGHPAPTQALGAFRQAHKLALDGDEHRDIRLQIALRLGQTLHQLGHLAEARQALEPAYNLSPGYPELAATYARVVVSLGDHQAALPALEIVIRDRNDDSLPHLEYGRAALAAGGEPQDAIAALQRALELNPKLTEAMALLAEALAASGDMNGALLAYQDALETDLIEHPDWSSRLALGLGRVALALHQPDIAIAALQEAANADPQNAHIARSLSEAYQEAGLLEDAIQAARSALRLALDDLEILSWFARQASRWFEYVRPDESEANQQNPVPWAVNLQVRVEAINALEHAIQLAPQRIDLLVQLGRVQMLAGDLTEATETLRRVASEENSDVEDLHQAARALLELNDAATAVACLERALHLLKWSAAMEGSITDKRKELYETLIQSYCHAGNTQAALETVEQALAIDNLDASLYSTKANLLLESGRNREALQCLEKAIELAEGSAGVELLHNAAFLYRSAGNLPAALEHAEKILEGRSQTTQHHRSLQARVLAADLARALLDPDRARAFLGVLPPLKARLENQDVEHVPSDEELSNYLEYLCLRAELALELGDQVDAEPAKLAHESVSVTAAIRSIASEDVLSPTRLRLNVIEARLLARNGDPEAGLQMLQMAIAGDEWAAEGNGRNQDKPGSEPPEDAQPFLTEAASYQVRNLLAVAEAALEFGQWDMALYLLRQAGEAAPLEPLSFINLARALALRAEAQASMQMVDVTNHIPGPAALAEPAFTSFKQAIETASQLVRGWNGVENGDETPLSQSAAILLARWESRGQAAFQPTQESAQELLRRTSFSPAPADIAAYITALRRSPTGEQDGTTALAIQAARTHYQNPHVLAQLALTLEMNGDNLGDALQAARQAVKNHSKQARSLCDSAIPLAASQTAVYNGLLARLALKSGDLQTATEAIQAALSIWPDEPRWHALAANASLTAENLPAAIFHLEQAVALEPQHIPHYLALGRAYLKQAAGAESQEDDEEPLIARAVQALEQASRLAPDQPEPWLALSRAHLSSHNLEQAVTCVERAITLSPDQAPPLLLKAEIALKAKEPQEAYDCIQTALRLKDARLRLLKDPSVILLLSRALDGLDRPEDAMAALEEVLPDAKEPLPLLLERVRLLERTKGASVSQEALANLGERYPDDPHVLALLAKSQARTGRPEAAISSAQRALQAISSQSADRQELDAAELAQLHLLLGSLLRQVGQLDQAIHHLNEAIHRSPSLLEPYLELGRAYQERRQPSQALQIYNQAARVSPRDPRPYYQSGLTLKDSKDYLGAESMLRRAAELAPSDVSIHRQLGAIVALNLVHNRRRRSLEA